MGRILFVLVLGASLAVGGLASQGMIQLPGAVEPTRAPLPTRTLGTPLPVGVPVTLSFSERDLTAAAAAYFPQALGPATVSNPRVKLVSGQLILECDAAVAVLRSSAVITATPLLTDGRPKVRIDNVTVAGQAVPDAVRASLAGQIDQAIASGLPPNFVVNSVFIANGTLTVTGIAKP